MDIGSARYWREIPQRFRYEAAKCDKCGRIFFPPRQVCSQCRGRAFTPTRLAQSGSVETFTVIRVAPTGFSNEAPYAVGVIKLDDGVKITAQIVDCDLERLAIGDKVKLEFRKVQQDGESGILCYGYKFVPVVNG
jgi:uncharacterized OB-fold protein